MARRFEEIYRVKPRDNLGDPEYWNRRFTDIDRRVSSNEDALSAVDSVTAKIEGVALDRLNLVLAPALERIGLVSDQGFLLAHSDTSNTLAEDATVTFVINDPAERDLFAPSPYLTLTRQTNTTDYAFMRLQSYNKVTGDLVAVVVQVFGNPGPFNDWVLYTGSAVTNAVKQMLADTKAARDLALSYKNSASNSATATSADRTAVATMRTDAQTARDQAQAFAQSAQTYDVSNYIRKDQAGTYTATITFTGGIRTANFPSQYGMPLSVKSGGIGFGHSNTGGYECTITHENVSGNAYIGFYVGPGTADNSYRTFGFKGSVFRSDKSGGFIWSVAPSVNSDNQTLTQLMSLNSDGTLNVSGKIVVPTPAQSENSVTVATTAFVKTAISNLVNSSPAALDTLNELAAALGNDANFSTTVTNSIATKLSKSNNLSDLDNATAARAFLGACGFALSATDLNSANIDGNYLCPPGTANSPASTHYCAVAVAKFSASALAQIAYDCDAGVTYFRRLRAGTWTAWTRYLVDNDLASISDIRTKTGTGITTVDTLWGAAAPLNVSGVTGSYSIDANTGSNFRLAMSGNVTMTPPTNMKPGQVINFNLIQPSGGGRTVSWSGSFQFPDGAAPLVSTGAGNYAVCGSIWYDGSYYHVSAWKTTS